MDACTTDQDTAAGEYLKKSVLRRRCPSAGFQGKVPCVVASVKIIAEPPWITPPEWLATLIPTDAGLQASVLRHSCGSGRLLLCLHSAQMCDHNQAQHICCSENSDRRWWLSHEPGTTPRPPSPGWISSSSNATTVIPDWNRPFLE